MLNSLFPHGFILIALFTLAVFMLGTSMGVVAASIGRRQAGMQTFFIGILLALLVGVVLSFLHYHMMWDMVCRSLTC